MGSFNQKSIIRPVFTSTLRLYGYTSVLPYIHVTQLLVTWT